MLIAIISSIVVVGVSVVVYALLKVSSDADKAMELMFDNLRVQREYERAEQAELTE